MYLILEKLSFCDSLSSLVVLPLPPLLILFKPLVNDSITHKDKLLIIGCGNSEISTDLYDNGYTNITNIDFSPLVIQEMKRKNTTRLSMAWEVADMTCMPQYADCSYDIIFDKGALDALMSEDTTDTHRKTVSMFREIDRILADKGKYICISLCENYISKALLNYFSNLKYEIKMKYVDNNKPSPFKPFYIILSKTQKAQTTLLLQSKDSNHNSNSKNNNDSSMNSKVSIYIDTLGNSIEMSRDVSTHTAMLEVQ